MTRTQKHLTISAIIGSIIALLILIGSCVYPTAAKAGGLGDFYKYHSCTAKTRAGETISGLTGVLSNYDIHNYTDQRYHHGTKITRAGWRQATPPLYNDETWPITKSEIWDAWGWSGWSNDGYQDFGYAAGLHTVTFIFSNGYISAKCSIRE